MNCLKLILKVEPSEAQALYLRGQANELMPETAHQALLDYQRAYDLTLTKPHKSGSILRKALESKLRKVGGPAIKKKIDQKRPTH